jgi:Zn-dependent protease
MNQPPGAIGARSNSDQCPQCLTELAPELLSCPSCHRLVHAARLAELAREADRARDGGDVKAAILLWREALQLLPPASRQYKSVEDKCAYLTHLLPADEQAAAVEAPAEPEAKDGGKNWKKGAAGAGAIALLIWKFKWVAAFALGKGKLLLAGFTKGGTLLSMLASFGLYWTAWGWKLGLGIVICIYVHEMGHVAELRRLGIKASAPMFVPGLGAFVRMKQRPASPTEDARVGLAGPLWGLGATLACYLIYLQTGAGVWGAIAAFSAWINLFNLLPVWQLDGSRAFGAMSRGQRLTAVAVIAGCWLLTNDGILLLIGIVAAIRAFGPDSKHSDAAALTKFAVLVVSLSALAVLAGPDLANTL